MSCPRLGVDAWFQASCTVSPVSVSMVWPVAGSEQTHSVFEKGLSYFC